MPLTILPFSKIRCKSHVHRCELMVYCLADGPPTTFSHETLTCSVCGLERLVGRWITDNATIRSMTINMLPPCLSKVIGRPEKYGLLRRNYICPICQNNGVPI